MRERVALRRSVAERLVLAEESLTRSDAGDRCADAFARSVRNTAQEKPLGSVQVFRLCVIGACRLTAIAASSICHQGKRLDRCACAYAGTDARAGFPPFGPHNRKILHPSVPIPYGMLLLLWGRVTRRAVWRGPGARDGRGRGRGARDVERVRGAGWGAPEGDTHLAAGRQRAAARGRRPYAESIYDECFT